MSEGECPNRKEGGEVSYLSNDDEDNYGDDEDEGLPGTSIGRLYFTVFNHYFCTTTSHKNVNVDDIAQPHSII